MNAAEESKSAFKSPDSGAGGGDGAPASDELIDAVELPSAANNFQGSAHVQLELSQAQAIVGACMEMASAKERKDREESRDLSVFEVVPGTGRGGRVTPSLCAAFNCL